MLRAPCRRGSTSWWAWLFLFKMKSKSQALAVKSAKSKAKHAVIDDCDTKVESDYQLDDVRWIRQYDFAPGIDGIGLVGTKLFSFSWDPFARVQSQRPISLKESIRVYNQLEQIPMSACYGAEIEDCVVRKWMEMIADALPA